MHPRLHIAPHDHKLVKTFPFNYLGAYIRSKCLEKYNEVLQASLIPVSYLAGLPSLQFPSPSRRIRPNLKPQDTGIGKQFCPVPCGPHPLMGVRFFRNTRHYAEEGVGVLGVCGWEVCGTLVSCKTCPTEGGAINVAFCRGTFYVRHYVRSMLYDMHG
jgi:hypothetical protein